MNEGGPEARLLIVEDSETQALVLRLMLEREGFAVDRTATAEAALDALNGELPDAMLVDYNLPGMNGDELVRLVRQMGRTRTLPLVMLTDDAAHDTERQGLDSGASAYVPKSGDPKLLLSRIRALLRQRRAPASAVSAAGGFRQARLLLVEESATYRVFLKTLLAGEGHAVAVAGDEAEITAALDGDAIDCVLIGLDARTIDPLALVRMLDGRRVARNEAFEIVGLGGDRDGGAVLDGLAAGADDVVPKANDRDMLPVRIRATLRRKLARDDEARAAAHERARDVELARAQATAEIAGALAATNRELEAANRRLGETQAQLVQAAKMASLGELVAGIAHEINNPLAFIMAHQATVARLVGEAGALEGEAKTAKLTRATDRLESIKGGLARIQELVVKLRRFSRLDDGEAVVLELPSAIDAVVTLLGPKFSGNVTVVRDYRGPERLACSPALINQVVMNILANAADALNGTGGTITIATRTEGTDAVIEIGDDGPGVPAEMRSRLFEPFFTTKDVGAGTGLGLAIAYGVVRAHGGTITVGSSAAGGASFTVVVPISERT
jgi:two-component system NtrC family sensor kinase